MSEVRAFLSDLWGSTRDWVGSHVSELHVYPGIALVGYAGYRVHEALGWGVAGVLLLYIGMRLAGLVGEKGA